MTIGRGIAQLANNNYNTDNIGSEGAAQAFKNLFYYGKFLGLYNGVWIALIVWALFFYVLSFTRSGRHIYAIGSNVDAARLSGVDVFATTTKAYMVSSFCAFLTGLVTMAQSGMGSMDAGMSYEMYAVAAAVIGGVSTLGGSGLLVGVTPEDFGGGPEASLAGVAFQRKLESDAHALAGGGCRAPAQRVEDFLLKRPSAGPGKVLPSYRPGVVWTNLWDCLPPFVAEALAEALPILGRKLRGYDHPDAVLTAVESRSSSPVRILRGKNGQSALRGLYPCGEGAGYAGGILSAAADGMRCAELLLSSGCESLP